jgi:hypothetical protein
MSQMPLTRQLQFLFIFLIVLFASCESKINYHDGLNNIVNTKNKKRCEFYNYSSRNNGVYIVYDKDSSIVVAGTYFDGRRNGIWDTLCNRNEDSEAFYHDDSLLIVFKAKYFFDYYKFENYDFTLLIPKTWEINDSLLSNGCFYSIATTFQGDYSPRFLIYRIDGDSSSVSSIIDKKYEKIVKKQSSVYNFKRVSNTRFSFSHFQDGDTLSYSAKVIKTKTGYYHFSCECQSRIYDEYYQYVFETIINSFNPISGTIQ